MIVWRGAVLALGCAAALLLGGCSVEGTLTVESAERIGVDLTVRDIAGAACEDYAEAGELGLQVTPVEGPGTSCRFLGSLSSSEFARANFLLVDAGEHLSIGVYPLGMGAPADADSLAELARLDLRMVFPGPVLRSSGTMSGNEASFTRDDLLEGGLTAVGQGHPGPPTWLLALGGGLAAGAAVGGPIGWAVRRRRGVAAADEAPEADDVDIPDDPAEPSADAPAPPRVAVDDSVWAPPDR